MTRREHRDTPPRGARIVAVLVLALTLALLLTPGNAVPDTDVPNSDKLVHAALFGLLAFTHALAWPRVRLPIMALIVIAFGAATEITQTVVPGRSADMLDLLADAAGAVLGLVIYARFWRR